MASFIRAVIDGFPCDVLDRTSDNYSRALVEHQVIGFDGAVIEDMGLTARTYNIETIWQDKYYPTHFLFIENFRRNTSLSSVTHPIYGTIWGKIKSIDVVNNAKEKECVHITVEFIESPSKQVFGVIPKISGIYLIAQSLVGEIMDAMAVVGAIISRMGMIEVICNQIESRIKMAQGIAGSLVKSLTFPTSIPGLVAKQAFRVTAGFFNDTVEVLESPKNMLVSFLEQTRQTARLFAAQDEVFDRAIRSAGVYLASLAAVSAFVDAAGKAGKNNTQTNNLLMNKRDIEESVNIIRREINELLKTDKAGTIQLQKLALEVAEEARKALAQIGGEREIEVGREISIYAILIENRINRMRAAQVCLRNNIENPSRVIGKIYLPEADF